MSRLLDALRNLQQPLGTSDSAPQRKVIPRLAASIRKAVLGNAAAQTRTVDEEPQVLFRVPDASPPEQSPPPPQQVPAEPLPPEVSTAPEEFRPAPVPPAEYSPDPVQLVEAIQASISVVQEELPACADVELPSKEPTRQPVNSRPQPTPGELELRAVLSDHAQSLPYQQLRAAIERDVSGSDAPVIAIVGLEEHLETGRVAAALATLLATERSKSVLLIEANPERELARLYGISSANGLSESLAGRAVRSNVVVATSHERLNVLPFGQATADQAQLLPQALPSEIAQVRGDCGATIIDAGSLSSSWALAASKAADAAYLIIQLGKTTTESAASIVQRFRASGGKLTGCIAVGQ